MRKRRRGSASGCACGRAALALALAAAGCSETLDAGSSRPRGKLPVDERNPIVLVNDNVYDNWQGEYALLLANGGGPKLVGIIVSTGGIWKSLDDNIQGWRDLTAAAHKSGMRNVPDLTSSPANPPLVRPASGEIDETVPNGSEGAHFIVNESSNLSLPYRPLVVVTGGRLTDVADAYLVDPTVKDRVVVVSSLGSVTESGGGAMSEPNGEMDPWADYIVTTKFRYVQVSAFYDQTTDVPDARLSGLPQDNDFADWIRAKQPKIWNNPRAADQVAVAAVGIRDFTVDVETVSAAGPVEAGATAGPALADDPNGPVWLVRESAGAEATKRFWQLLLDPKTFGR